jgi:hypothetical protein
MKWFKHDSDANLDDKLQNLMLDHGLKGYGLYWYCLELIANKFDHTNINLDLKHDARIIAKNTGETTKEVEDMMRRMVELDLFSQSQGIIQCLKLGTRFEASASSHPLVRDMVKQLKATNGKVVIKSQSNHNIVTAEEKRIEEKRTEENKLLTDFNTFYSKYPNKVKRANAEKAWLKHKPDIDIVMKALEYQLSNDRRFKDAQFIPHPTTWINGKEWENEVIKKKGNSTYL